MDRKGLELSNLRQDRVFRRENILAMLRTGFLSGRAQFSVNWAKARNSKAIERHRERPTPTSEAELALSTRELARATTEADAAYRACITE